MPDKPRPLGNKAKGLVERADWQLAAADVRLSTVAGDGPETLLERKLAAERARTLIADARRLLIEVLTLREGNKP